MAIPKRATVYLEPKVHKALKLKAAETDSSISDLVNEAVVVLLNEDAEDLEAFDKREREPAMDFQAFLKQLKKDGDI
mgnify:CR=1 FL=1